MNNILRKKKLSAAILLFSAALMEIFFSFVIGKTGIVATGLLLAVAVLFYFVKMIRTNNFRL